MRNLDDGQIVRGEADKPPAEAAGDGTDAGFARPPIKSGKNADVPGPQAGCGQPGTDRPGQFRFRYAQTGTYPYRDQATISRPHALTTPQPAAPCGIGRTAAAWATTRRAIAGLAAQCRCR